MYTLDDRIKRAKAVYEVAIAERALYGDVIDIRPTPQGVERKPVNGERLGRYAAAHHRMERACHGWMRMRSKKHSNRWP